MGVLRRYLLVSAKVASRVIRTFAREKVLHFEMEKVTNCFQVCCGAHLRSPRVAVVVVACL